MRRRAVLASIGTGTALVGGCLSFGDAGSSGPCPGPELDDELPYDSRNTPVLEGVDTGVAMATAPDEVDRFHVDGFSDDDAEWVDETEFDEAVLVGFQLLIGGGGSNSGLELNGIERDDDGTVRVYSCIHDTGGGDAAIRYARLLRVFYGERPLDAAAIHHRTEGAPTVLETGD